MRCMLFAVALLASPCNESTDTETLDMALCSGECVTARCADQVHNGDETDVDCGGACGTCAIGKLCLVATDCATGFCTAGTCAAKPPGMTCSNNSQCGSGVCG